MITRRTLLASGGLTMAATAVPQIGIAHTAAVADDAPLSPDMPRPFGGSPVVTLPGDPTLHRVDTGWLFHKGDIPVAEPRGNDETYN